MQYRQVVLRIDGWRSDGTPDVLVPMRDDDVAELSTDPLENQFIIAFVPTNCTIFEPDPKKIPNSHKDPS